MQVIKLFDLALGALAEANLEPSYTLREQKISILDVQLGFEYASTLGKKKKI